MLKIKSWNSSQMLLSGCGCKACYHSEMSKPVTLKENGHFSYQIPLLPWGPTAFCMCRQQTTARCRRLCKVTYPTSFWLSLPTYRIKPQPKAITLFQPKIYLREAPLHIAFNKRAATMHRSLISHIHAERLWEAFLCKAATVTGNKGGKN